MRRPLFAVLALVLTACASPRSGQVLHVVDGDTVRITQDGRPVMVRLAAVDAPERDQPGGPEATAELTRLLGAGDVTVQPTDRDRYGRTVAKLTAGGVDVSAELIRTGAAWHFKRYDQDPALDALEAEARAARRGLWSSPDPVAPWDYRHGSRVGVAALEPVQPAAGMSLPIARDRECGSKTRCTQMTTCDEARFYLSQCGVRGLDRDRDGIPCESVC